MALDKATPAPKPSGKRGKAAQNDAIKDAMAGQAAAKATKSKASNTVTAAPKVAVDRAASSAARAEKSPCEAASGTVKSPRPCKGVGVVKEKPTNARRQITICAAHVLAAKAGNLRAFKEAAEAAEKEAVTA